MQSAEGSHIQTAPLPKPDTQGFVWMSCLSQVRTAISNRYVVEGEGACVLKDDDRANAEAKLARMIWARIVPDR